MAIVVVFCFVSLSPRTFSVVPVVVFFFVLRPAPTVTFFPYTTLFRSGVVGPDVQGDRVGAVLLRPLENRLGEDRKSTRLNSSHVATSYAVFCLKKKTTMPSGETLSRATISWVHHEGLYSDAIFAAHSK